MIRLAIIDEKGKILSPKDVATVAELLPLVEQARQIIRDCELQARERGKQHGPGTGTVPYS
jgi:hypothetical protein